MLILTRRQGETLRIGDNITLTVTSIKGEQIKLGIDAPLEVNVARLELRESDVPSGLNTKP